MRLAQEDGRVISRTPETIMSDDWDADDFEVPSFGAKEPVRCHHARREGLGLTERRVSPLAGEAELER